MDGQGKGFREYLVNLPKKTESPVHRRPFDGKELDAIYAAAREVDPELYPVLVAAACTALRRGDVCRLRWDGVDLEEDFVTVKTTKTGETVEIPIFPPFRAVLEEALGKRKKGVPYVWPKIALAYARNADNLNGRLGRILAVAGFAKPEKRRAGKYAAPEDEEAAAAMLEDGMVREKWRNASKVKARQILKCHFSGMNGKAIAEALNISRASVSEYLHAMEEAGRVALVSPPKREDSSRLMLAEMQDGEQRKQRGSLAGWHSFRTTFCTLALANGVPIEILQKITGHRTVEIVLKHYDRRGREAMRKAIGSAMPKAIAGKIEPTGHSSAKGRERVDFEAVALPPELAKMLAKASPEQLVKVRKIFVK